METATPETENSGPGAPCLWGSGWPRAIILDSSALELPRFRGDLMLWGQNCPPKERSSPIAKSRLPYPEEFRRQMVDLVRAGRTPESLSREFEPTAQAIRNWVRQSDLDSGRRHDGLTSQERGELRRLRRENQQQRLEREILAKAAAWFARETGTVPKEFSGS